MRHARPQLAARVALALAVTMAVVWGSALAFAFDGEATAAGTSISNRAEASYRDSNGTAFGTVSETVTLLVRAVSAVVVTPDESEPSATVSPNERAVRLFRVCNAGNTPDLHTLTRAEVGAPATLAGLFYDADNSGTLTDGDRPRAGRHRLRPAPAAARLLRPARRRRHQPERARLAPDD